MCLKKTQYYNERKKNSKAENKATREKNQIRNGTSIKGIRERKRKLKPLEMLYLFLCFSFFFWGQIWKTNLPKFEFFIQKQAMYK